MMKYITIIKKCNQLIEKCKRIKNRPKTMYTAKIIARTMVDMIDLDYNIENIKNKINIEQLNKLKELLKKLDNFGDEILKIGNLILDNRNKKKDLLV